MMEKHMPPSSARLWHARKTRRSRDGRRIRPPDVTKVNLGRPLRRRPLGVPKMYTPRISGLYSRRSTTKLSSQVKGDHLDILKTDTDPLFRRPMEWRVGG